LLFHEGASSQQGTPPPTNLHQAVEPRLPQDDSAHHVQTEVEKALATAADARHQLEAAERAKMKAESEVAAVKAQLDVANQRIAEEQRSEQRGEIFGAFFSGLLVMGFIASLVMLRNSYKALSVKQMSTIVHLNEERVKLFTKLQANPATAGLSSPLLP